MSNQLFSSRNRAVCSFILYHFGDKSFDHSEITWEDVYLYFDINKKDVELTNFFNAYRSVGELIKQLKPYAEPTPRQKRSTVLERQEDSTTEQD